MGYFGAAGMDVKTRIRKDREAGLWNVHDQDLTFPATSWGEAMHFVHDLRRHRSHEQVFTTQQIVAEEYPHFVRLLGPALAKQRLATVYGVKCKTIEDYVRKGSKCC